MLPEDPDAEAGRLRAQLLTYLELPSATPLAVVLTLVETTDLIADPAFGDRGDLVDHQAAGRPQADRTWNTPQPNRPWPVPIGPAAGARFHEHELPGRPTKLPGQPQERARA